MTIKDLVEHGNACEYHLEGRNCFGIPVVTPVPIHRKESNIPKALVTLSDIGNYFERIKGEFPELMCCKTQFEQFELVHNFFLEGEVNDLKDSIYFAQENEGFNFKFYEMYWKEFVLRKEEYIQKVKTQADYVGRMVFPEYRRLYDAFAEEYERVVNELCCLFMESQGLSDLANEPIEVRKCFDCEHNHTLFLKRIKALYNGGDRGCIMSAITEVGFIVMEGIWPKNELKLLRNYLSEKGYVFKNGTWDARFRNHDVVKADLRKIYKIPSK